MKIKLTCGLAGPKVSFAPGEIVEMPEGEARRHIAAGNAEEYVEPSPAASAPSTTPIPPPPEPVVTRRRGGNSAQSSGAGESK